MLSLQNFNKKEEFLSAAGEQIRWKRARKPLLYELETHISDRCDALVSEGMEEKEAEAKAVSEMGDPEAIGLELDRVHRPKPNYLLIGGAAALFILGIALLRLVGGKTEQLTHMLIFGGIGIVFLVLGYFCDYTVLSKFSLPAFGVMCGICIIFPLMGNAFASTAAQLCYAMPLVFAGVVYSLKSPYKPYILSGAAVLILFVSMLSFSTVSTFVYLFIVCGVILVYSAAKGIISSGKFKAWLPAASFLALFLLIIVSALANDGAHLLRRRFMEGALNPEADPLGGGWVPLRIRELLDTSVFVGAGETSEFSEVFMRSSDFTLKDYTLAVASHKLGLIVFIAVCSILLLMIGAVIIGAKKQSCTLSKLVILSIGISFALRIAAYISCNLGFTLISFDGIPLFSYNGKLLVIDMFITGLLLSVFRMESISRDSSAGRYASAKS